MIEVTRSGEGGAPAVPHHPVGALSYATNDARPGSSATGPASGQRVSTVVPWSGQLAISSDPPCCAIRRSIGDSSCRCDPTSVPTPSSLTPTWIHSPKRDAETSTRLTNARAQACRTTPASTTRKPARSARSVSSGCTAISSRTRCGRASPRTARISCSTSNVVGRSDASVAPLPVLLNCGCSRICADSDARLPLREKRSRARAPASQVGRDICNHMRSIWRHARRAPPFCADFTPPNDLPKCRGIRRHSRTGKVPEIARS